MSSGSENSLSKMQAGIKKKDDGRDNDDFRRIFIYDGDPLQDLMRLVFVGNNCLSISEHLRKMSQIVMDEKGTKIKENEMA